jgi:hypothetical protein
LAKFHLQLRTQGSYYLFIWQQGIWMAKLVVRPLATAALRLGSNADISQKYKMSDISKGVANTL